MRPPAVSAAPLLVGLLVAGCGHDWDDLDPRLASGVGGASVGSGGAGPATSSPGAGGLGGASSSGGPGGSTTTSVTVGSGTGATGGAGTLVDRGLVVRYYLDEADSGQTPTEALDAAPDPLAMPLIYTAGMAYANVGGHRGLSWNAIELDGRASVAIASTKIETALQGKVAATIESVVEISAVSPSNSRISHIGSINESGHLTLSTGNTGALNFFWFPPSASEPLLAALYPVAFPARGRVVLHLVLDVTQANAADRARLFVDGVEVEATTSMPPLPTDTIALGLDNYFALGNREIGARSFVGVLYYSAMYATALTVAEVQNNAGVLAANDDTP